MSDGDYETRLKATGRNDRCPCGSGKKYKKCHLAEDEGARAATLKALEEEAAARSEAATDAEDQAETKGMDTSPRSMRGLKQQHGSKMRASEGKPKHFPRRGAV